MHNIRLYNQRDKVHLTGLRAFEKLSELFMTKGAIQQMNGGFHLPCGNACTHHAEIMKEVDGSEVEERKLVA